MESRIRGNVYVRFGGRYRETRLGDKEGASGAYPTMLEVVLLYMFVGRTVLLALKYRALFQFLECNITITIK